MLIFPTAPNWIIFGNKIHWQKWILRFRDPASKISWEANQRGGKEERKGLWLIKKAWSLRKVYPYNWRLKNYNPYHLLEATTRSENQRLTSDCNGLILLKAGTLCLHGGEKGDSTPRYVFPKFHQLQSWPIRANILYKWTRNNSRHPMSEWDWTTTKTVSTIVSSSDPRFLARMIFGAMQGCWWHTISLRLHRVKEDHFEWQTRTNTFLPASWKFLHGTLLRSPFFLSHELAKNHATKKHQKLLLWRTRLLFFNPAWNSLTFTPW